jgi:hypothetical protein
LAEGWLSRTQHVHPRQASSAAFGSLLAVRVIGDHPREAEGFGGAGEGEGVLDAPCEEGAGVVAANGGERLQREGVGAGFDAARPLGRSTL